MPRLFTAIEIARDTATRLALTRGGLPAARWIEPENYHLTLRFIGDVDSRTADEIVAHLDRIERTPFELTLDGVFAFGSKKPHSLYAAVRPCEALDALQGEIDRTLRRLGVAGDARKFVPHVTLARLRNARADDVAHWLSGRGGFLAPPFEVTRFVLQSSKDSVGGGPYVLEEAFALRGRSRRDGNPSAPHARALDALSPA